MVLAHVKFDRDELRQERDDWRREARCSALRCSSPRSSERLTSGMSLPRSAAHGGDASRQARNPGGAE
jgi:hypothetical protein